MAFNQAEAEVLLAQTGRLCCICKRLHRVQLHHIIPKEAGGSDDIDNAIPLCPNCHDEVHSGPASGRVTRSYTPGELQQHRQQTMRIMENIHPPAKEDPVTGRRILPEAYLDKLPKIKYKAYIAAHKLWDRGVTSDMVNGNHLLAEKLRGILIDIAETVYTPEAFEGNSVAQYYDDLVARLTKASQEAQPDDRGTMHRVLATSSASGILDNCIIKLVGDFADPAYFSTWKAKWEKAQKIGEDGEEIDLDTTNEL